STDARAEIVNLFLMPRILEDKFLSTAVLHDLQHIGEPSNPPARIDRLSVLRVRDRFADPHLGDGLTRLRKFGLNLDDGATSEALIDSGRVAEIDQVGRQLSDENAQQIASVLSKAVANNKPDSIQAVASLVELLTQPDKLVAKIKSIVEGVG